METKTGEETSVVTEATSTKVPISITRALHSRLLELKKHPRETFNEVVERLVEEWNLQQGL